MKTLPPFLSIGLLSLLAACGGGGSSSSSSGSTNGGPTSCTSLELEEFEVGGASSVAVLSSTTKTNIDGASPDYFYIELYDFTTGTFVLGAGEDENYNNCNRCVVIYSDIHENEYSAAYFASSGELSLESFTYDGVTREISTSGLVRNLRLIEVTINPSTETSTPVTNGACYEIVGASWDLTVNQN